MLSTDGLGNLTWVNQAAGSSNIDYSEVRLHTGNGWGSTGTAIRRFTTTVRNVGSDITYTDSATSGASFTINNDGNYFISFHEHRSNLTPSGISINSSDLTAGIETLATAEVLALSRVVATGQAVIKSWAGFLQAGDVIRAQSTGASEGTSPGFVKFSIVRLRCQARLFRVRWRKH